MALLVLGVGVIEISLSVFKKSKIDQMGPSQEHVSDNLEYIGGVQ